MDDAQQAGPNPSGLCGCGCGQRTPVARTTFRARGWVKGRPIRYLKHHRPRTRIGDHAVDPETGCWDWRGPTSGGYAVMAVGGKTVLAARVYWEAANGPIPDGHKLRRTCGRAGCVNPGHGDAVPRNTPVGGAARAKLSDKDIRAVLEAGTSVPLGELARRYGVTVPTVHHVLSGRRRANVAPELPRPLAREGQTRKPVT